MSRSSAHMSAENGLEDEEEDGDLLDDDADATRLERFTRDRRRARSLPACTAALLDGDTGRKRVKFADSMGLTLTSVKHFSSLEEPRIPTKVLSRHRRSFPLPLQDRDPLTDLCQSFKSSLDAVRLVPSFPELRDVERRVQRLRVCLEDCVSTRFDLRGKIRVLSGSCASREVGVRYTFNDWLTHVDAQAVPVPADQQRGLVGERFSFTLVTPPFPDPGSAVRFAVFTRSEEGEFWDNNEGQNYTLRYHGGSPGTAACGADAFPAT
ncbi:protein phosphatase 1 regulatory subunit 3G [Pholidichthys leucotaenia]